MSSIVGIIFSSGTNGEIPELTQRRATGSIPFGGRYRLIDFVLSNLVNAGATRVGVITKNNYQSLMDHIGTGKDWDLARKSGGLILLPPFSTGGGQLYTTRMEALKGIPSFLNRSTEEYVVLCDCDIVYNIDFNEVIKYHESKFADVTVVYKSCEDEVLPSGVRQLSVTEDGRVRGLTTKSEGAAKKYMKIMVMKKRMLQMLISVSPSNYKGEMLIDLIDNEVSSLNVYAYEYKGYYAYIDSLQSYYKNNLKLLLEENRDALFNIPNRPIYTKVKDSPPTRYGTGSRAVNSFIADGCSIFGEVENSIIFRGAVIEKGASVKNCIVMQDNYIGQNASLNCVITDKNVIIGEKRVLSGAETLPFFIYKGRRV